MSDRLREAAQDVAAELRWRKADTTDADLARVLEAALATTHEGASHESGGATGYLSNGSPAGDAPSSAPTEDPPMDDGRA